MDVFSPSVDRVGAGIVAWLLLVYMTWELVHVMAIFIVVPLLPFAVASAALYVYRTVRDGGRRPRAIAAAFLLTTGLVWTEAIAIQAADHLAGEMLAKERGKDFYRKPPPSTSSYLLGVLLFLAGRTLSSRQRGRVWTVLTETVAVASIPLIVSYLVETHPPPLST